MQRNVHFTFSISIPISVPMLHLLHIIIQNTQQQGMCPPDKSSYLVSEVHIRSILNQFLYNPYPPLPSSHHEGCLKILHGIQKKIKIKKKSLNTKPRAYVPTYNTHVPGKPVVTIVKRSRYRTMVSGSANAQQPIERKRKVMYSMYQSGDTVLIASARLLIMAYNKPWQTANQSSLSINYVQLRHTVLNSILNHHSTCTEVSFPSLIPIPQPCTFMKVNSHQQRHLPSHKALLHDVHILQYRV